MGRPEVRLTKLAPGNPVGIVIKTAVYPEVTLPKHWRTLFETVPDDVVPGVEEREIADALESIRRAHVKAQNKTAPESNSNTLAAAEVDSAANPGTESNSSAAGRNGDAAESDSVAASTHPVTDVPDESTLPPLDDAFAQSLGVFTDLADLKAKMRENLENEKKQKVKDQRRNKIIEALLEQVQLSVPAIFVDSELEKIVAQMHDDVTRYNMTFEQYLQRIDKTEDEVRQELRDQAGKRAKLQLVLNKIATDEKIEADKEPVDTEMKHALEHFPEARPDLLRIHIETVLRNEKVLQLLEGTPQVQPISHEGHDHAGHSHE